MSSSRMMTIGVDLGGTKIRGGLCDWDNQIIHESTIPTRKNSENLVTRLLELIHGLIEKSSANKISGIVIGGAGTVSKDGDGFNSAPNLAELGSENIRAEIQSCFGIPTALENDVNVAAYGEYSFYPQKKLSSLAYVSVGTGIGLGIVLEGRLFRGVNNSAGEIGLIPIGRTGITSSKAGRGALEDLVAGNSFAMRYEKLTGKTATGNSIIRLAENSDLEALRVIDEESNSIAFAISCVQAILSPEVIVLGGGIGSERLIFEKTVEHLKELMPMQINLTQSLVPDNAAPILGAAMLAKTFFNC